MDEQVMNDLLADAISRYSAISGSPAVKLTAKKLKMQSASKRIQISGNDTFSKVRDAVNECGKIMLEDENRNLVEALVKSGSSGMNPAVVVAKTDGETMDICAYAKEGLINQHTAEKAIEKVMSKLE